MDVPIFHNERDYVITCGDEVHTLKTEKFVGDAVRIFYPDAFFSYKYKEGSYRYYSCDKKGYIYVTWDSLKDI